MDSRGTGNKDKKSGLVFVQADPLSFILLEKSLWRRNNANAADQCDFGTVEARNFLVNREAVNLL